MGAEASKDTQGEQLQKGVQVINKALQSQYEILQKLSAQCSKLQQEREKKQAELDALNAQIVRCKKTVEILSDRDKELSEKAATLRGRSTGYLATRNNRGGKNQAAPEDSE